MRFFLSLLIGFYLFLLRITCRVVVHGEDTLTHNKNTQTPACYAVWHGRLLLCAPMWLQKKWGKMVILSSTHRDGKLIARAAKLNGISVVFGSSSAGGVGALRGLIKAGKEDSNLFLTPDGPTGPRHVAKLGVVETARLTHQPIIPIGISASGRHFKSWDNFLFIRPFAKIHVVYGAPMSVPKDKKARETLRAELEKILIQLEQQADNCVHKSLKSHRP